MRRLSRVTHTIGISKRSHDLPLSSSIGHPRPALVVLRRIWEEGGLHPRPLMPQAGHLSGDALPLRLRSGRLRWCMTRYGLRIVPLVFPGNREASLMKTLAKKRTCGLAGWLGSHCSFVPPNLEDPYD